MRKRSTDGSSTGKAPRRPGTSFHGIERRYMVPGWPSLTGTHEAAAFTVLNQTGLAGAWRFYTERFTGPGRWFMWATIAFHLSGFNALELQAHVPMLYAITLWGTALLGMFRARPRVGLKAQHAERVCTGETMPVEVEVTHHGGPAGLNLTVLPHRLPAQLDAVPAEGVALPSLEKSGKARARIGLRCKRRGVYRLQGFRVETDFRFGLMKAYRTFKQEQRLLVYPKFTPLQHLHVAAGPRRNSTAL